MILLGKLAWNPNHPAILRLITEWLSIVVKIFSKPVHIVVEMQGAPLIYTSPVCLGMDYRPGFLISLLSQPQHTTLSSLDWINPRWSAVKLNQTETNPSPNNEDDDSSLIFEPFRNRQSRLITWSSFSFLNQYFNDICHKHYPNRICLSPYHFVEAPQSSHYR